MDFDEFIDKLDSKKDLSLDSFVDGCNKKLNSNNFSVLGTIYLLKDVLICIVLFEIILILWKFL